MLIEAIKVVGRIIMLALSMGLYAAEACTPLAPPPDSGEVLFRTDKVNEGKAGEAGVFFYYHSLLNRYRFTVCYKGHVYENIHNRLFYETLNGLHLWLSEDSATPLLHLSVFGHSPQYSIELNDADPNLSKKYRALEAYVMKNYPNPDRCTWRIVNGCGMLKQTSFANIEKRLCAGPGCTWEVCVIYPEGQISRHDEKAIAFAYQKEGLKLPSKIRGDRDAFLISFAKDVSRDCNIFLLNRLSEIPSYESLPIDQDLENAVCKPYSFSNVENKVNCNYVVFYTYSPSSAAVLRYRLRFTKDDLEDCTIIVLGYAGVRPVVR